MKNNNKNRLKLTFYYKVSIVLSLIDQLRGYGLNIAFDNIRTNQYKLIINDGEYIFREYDGVIESLNLLLDILSKKKGKKK